MVNIYADAGTSWTKLVEVFENKEELCNTPLDKFVKSHAVSTIIDCIVDNSGNQRKARFTIVPTMDLNRETGILFDAATGHMSKSRIKQGGKYENELVSLALGGMKLVKEEDITLLDLGSRDSKWIRYKGKKYNDLNWNGSCGSGTGATIEMLCNFYGVNPKTMKAQEEKITVTCGVFGMEKIMDLIAKGEPPEKAIAKYIHGIAFNAWKFCQSPSKLYLSGGLCLNQCFVESLELYCKVIPLGRYVLINGLF